jgi:hypothetical protein
MNEDKKIKIFYQNWWWDHQERKNKFKDYSPKNIENSYLISSEQILLKLSMVS